MQIISLLSLFLVFSFVADVSCFFLVTKINQNTSVAIVKVKTSLHSCKQIHTHSIIVVAGGAGLV